MTQRKSRGQLPTASMLIAVALVGLLAPVAARAGKTTCLTGTDASVAADPGQIAAVRVLVDASCACASFDGSAGKTHAKYVSCASGVITTQVGAGQLRKQCKATVKKYYSTSTCGVLASKGMVPCVKKTTGGKVTCAITANTKCVDKAGKYTQAACGDFTRCIDAADTNGDGSIGAGDTGVCLAPPGCCDLALFCSDGDASIAAACQGFGGTWVPGHHCTCDAQSCTCAEGTPLPTIPVPTNTPTATPTPDPRYTDNGDGTITDTQTGLMWEKKDDAGGIHDKDNTYSWSSSGTVPDGTAFTVFLAGLNTSPCFAGHCDWRLPSASGCCGVPTGQPAELASIVLTAPPCGNVFDPCVSSAFNSRCTAGCAASTCSCTAASFYWTASTTSNGLDAWGEDFAGGHENGYANKTVPLAVRAVR